MKKVGLLLIIMALTLPLLLSLIPAQDTGLPFDPEKTEEQIEKIPKDKNETSYLLGEWRKIFEKNPVGKVLIKIWDLLKIPLTLITGIEAGFTWKFFIALGSIVFLIFWLSFLVSLMPFSKLTSWVVGGAFLILLIISKIIANVAIFLDNLLNKWWGRLILILIFVILIVVSRVFKKNAEKQKEEQKKIQEEVDREKLRAHVEIVGKMSEG